jgi:hypothetical protein
VLGVEGVLGVVGAATIASVASEILVVVPIELVAVAAIRINLPTSPDVNVYVELVAPEMFVHVTSLN